MISEADIRRLFGDILYQGIVASDAWKKARQAVVLAPPAEYGDGLLLCLCIGFDGMIDIENVVWRQNITFRA